MSRSSIIFVGILLWVYLPMIMSLTKPKPLDRLGCSGYCNTTMCPYSSPGTIIALPCTPSKCITGPSQLYKYLGYKPLEYLIQVKDVSYCRHSPYFNPADPPNGTIICEVPGHVIPEGYYSCQTGPHVTQHITRHIVPFSSNIHVFYDYGEVAPKQEEGPLTVIWGGDIYEIITILTQHNCPIMKRIRHITCTNVNSFLNGQSGDFTAVKGLRYGLRTTAEDPRYFLGWGGLRDIS
jgi:hypothetical protein